MAHETRAAPSEAMGVPHSSTDQEDDALRPPGGAADNTAPSAQADHLCFSVRKCMKRTREGWQASSAGRSPWNSVGGHSPVMMLMSSGNSTGRAAVHGVQPLIHMHWRWHPRTSLRRQQQWPRFGACVSGPHWGSHRLLAYCLAVQMERLGSRTYEGMARVLLGPAFDYVTAVLRSLNTFGACVSFIISVGTSLRPFLTTRVLRRTGNRSQATAC
ncbi:putative amino acid transporter [Trypanosoma cruzi]|uniref:Putative amino acid transporter n=1 Tax=Trypanosoma cruzi TaxID=5693 RepID=A0A2V2UJ06_TRYCR|nr:putative amino acid transporter [Trypanosoma cruzi]